MESRSMCREDDLVCIASELLSRWERRERARLNRAADRPALKSTRDCLPCLIEDFQENLED